MYVWVPVPLFLKGHQVTGSGASPTVAQPDLNKLHLPRLFPNKVTCLYVELQWRHVPKPVYTICYPGRLLSDPGTAR